MHSSSLESFVAGFSAICSLQLVLHKLQFRQSGSFRAAKTPSSFAHSPATLCAVLADAYCHMTEPSMVCSTRPTNLARVSEPFRRKPLFTNLYTVPSSCVQCRDIYVLILHCLYNFSRERYSLELSDMNHSDIRYTVYSIYVK